MAILVLSEHASLSEHDVDFHKTQDHTKFIKIHVHSAEGEKQCFQVPFYSHVDYFFMKRAERADRQFLRLEERLAELHLIVHCTASSALPRIPKRLQALLSVVDDNRNVLGILSVVGATTLSKVSQNLARFH